MTAAHFEVVRTGGRRVAVPSPSTLPRLNAPVAHPRRPVAAGRVGQVSSCVAAPAPRPASRVLFCLLAVVALVTSTVSCASADDGPRAAAVAFLSAFTDRDFAGAARTTTNPTRAERTLADAWDGLNADGLAMPRDFDRVLVHQLGVADPIGSIANRQTPMVLSEVVIGDEYEFWLSAIDRSGNEGGAGAHSSITVASIMDDPEALKDRLIGLRQEHRDLDDVIRRIVGEAPFDQLQIQRLKKRKLALKDQIAKIESQLLPDIIA